MSRAIYLIIFLVWLGGTNLKAQTSLDCFLAASTRTAEQKIRDKERITAFIANESTFRGTEKKLLQRTFRKVHTTFLKKYEAYSDFGELASSGKYDCLTATALFSHVLGELNFRFDIIETNYHIFMIVHTAQGDVLLETTDRVKGLIADPQLIATRTENYRRNSMITGDSNHFFYAYRCNLYQKIQSDKLAGLLFFNQAVRAYNQGEWLKCARLLEKANALYSSERCDELGIILARTIMEPVVSEEIRTACMAHLQNLWPDKARSVASN